MTPIESNPSLPMRDIDSIQPDSHETMHDLRAVLSFEEQVSNHNLTANELMEDVVTNPQNYHDTLLPHIGRFLARNGLDEEVQRHSHIFFGDTKPVNVSNFAQEENSAVSSSPVATARASKQPAIWTESSWAEKLDIEDEDIFNRLTSLEEYPDFGTDDFFSKLVRLYDKQDSWVDQERLRSEIFRAIDKDLFKHVTVKTAESLLAPFDAYHAQILGPSGKRSDVSSYGFSELGHTAHESSANDAGYYIARNIKDNIEEFAGLSETKLAKLLINREFDNHGHFFSDTDKPYQADIYHESDPMDSDGLATILRYLVDCAPESGWSEEVTTELIAKYGLRQHIDLREYEEYIENEPEPKRIVDESLLDFIKRHHDKFDLPSFDSSLAYELVKRGGSGYVINNPDKFEDLKIDNDLAFWMIDAGAEKVVIKFLKLFPDSSFELAKRLVAVAPEAVRNNLHYFKNLNESQLAEMSEWFNMSVREFPFKGNRREQYEWFSEFAFQEMGDGWRKANIGQLIALRLELVDNENDLQEASQWLSDFRIPSQGYDVGRIQALKTANPDMPANELLSQSEVVYRGEELEHKLLQQIFQASPELRARLNVPTKEQKVDSMFTGPANRFIYTLLARNLADDSLYTADFNVLYGLAEAQFDQFYTDLAGKVSNSRTTASILDKGVLWQNVKEQLQSLNRPVEGSITETVSILQEYAANRQSYIDDTQSWLLRHATAPNSKLTKAWGDRPIALASGVKDSLPDILLWQQENAFRVTLENIDEHSLPEEMTREELLSDKWKAWRKELGRVYSAIQSIEAIGKASKWLKTSTARPKLLPAAGILIPDPDKGPKNFKFEVLRSDDPRGFTLGKDTGCCMTLSGQASSCIKAGYANPNAGFVALYDTEDRLMAQSFFYVNPDFEDALVLDNIEANEGRDFGKITRLYKQAFEQYIEEHDELPIKNIHIGEGYTEVNIRHLPSVNPIPHLKGVYSDSERQRKLI